MYGRSWSVQNYPQKQLIERRSMKSNMCARDHSKILNNYFETYVSNSENIPCAKCVSMLGDLFLKMFQKMRKNMKPISSHDEVNCLKGISLQANKIGKLINDLKMTEEGLKFGDTSDSIKFVWKANPNLEHVKNAKSSTRENKKISSKFQPLRHT